MYFSLDADSLIHKNYLFKIVAEYQTNNFDSAVFNFEHQSNNNPEIIEFSNDDGEPSGTAG